MLTIIEKAARADGGHALESQSHRTENWMGPGWIEVPPHLEGKAWDCCGYCELDIRDGKLADLVPGERPPVPEPPETLSTEELTDIVRAMSGGVDNV